VELLLGILPAFFGHFMILSELMFYMFSKLGRQQRLVKFALIGTLITPKKGKIQFP